MIYAGLMALGTALGVPLAAAGGGIGMGLAAAGALQAIGRQPEAVREIQTNLILSLAMIESLVIYSLLVFFMFQGRLPAFTELLKANLLH